MRRAAPEEAARLVRGRAVPKIDREGGDPFERGDLSDRQRAARLEGKKVETKRLFAGIIYESLYRVDLFRRYLPDNGISGLVQFYGPRARRQYEVGTEPGGWTVGKDNEMHTLSIGDISKIRRK